METVGLGRAQAATVGVILVVIGLLGFAPNPIVGNPALGDGPLFHAGTALSIVHVVAGAALLFVAFAVSGTAQANGIMASGVGFGVLLALTLASPRLFGLLDVPTNLPDHVLHAALAAIGIVVGWMARNQERAAEVAAGR